jgi:hypothetical protein
MNDIVSTLTSRNADFARHGSAVRIGSSWTSCRV